MKKNIMLCILFFISLFSFTNAQKYNFSFYGGTYLDAGSIDGSMAVKPNLGIGLIINEKWTVGAYGGILANSIVKDLTIESTGVTYEDGKIKNLNFGGWLGYNQVLNGKFGIGYYLNGGLGNYRLSVDDEMIETIDDWHLTLQPRVELQYYLSDKFRLGLSAGYLAAIKMNGIPFENKDFSSPVVSLGIFYGKFGKE